MLDGVFPEYQNSRIFSCFFGQASRALLKIAPTPGKILSLPVEEWVIYLEAHSRKLGWERAYEKARENTTVLVLEDFLIQEAAYLILYLKSAYHKGIFYSGQVFVAFEHLVVQEKLLFLFHSAKCWQSQRHLLHLS